MRLNNYDVTRPGKIMTALKQQYAKATTASRRESLIKRHAVVELRVKRLLDLVSMKPISDKIN
jgi:hypothetical protein